MKRGFSALMGHGKMDDLSKQLLAIADDVQATFGAQYGFNANAVIDAPASLGRVYVMWFLPNEYCPQHSTDDAAEPRAVVGSHVPSDF